MHCISSPYLFSTIGQEVAGLVASVSHNWRRYCPEPWTDLTCQGTPMGTGATLHFSACGELWRKIRGSYAVCHCSLPTVLLQLVWGATKTGLCLGGGQEGSGLLSPPVSLPSSMGKPWAEKRDFVESVFLPRSDSNVVNRAAKLHWTSTQDKCMKEQDINFFSLVTTPNQCISYIG